MNAFRFLIMLVRLVLEGYLANLYGMTTHEYDGEKLGYGWRFAIVESRGWVYLGCDCLVG